MRVKSYVGGGTQRSHSYSLAGARVHTKQTARVHTKQTLPLPLQYINYPTPDDQFISSPSWLPSPRYELRTLASYTVHATQAAHGMGIKSRCGSLMTKVVGPALRRR